MMSMNAKWAMTGVMAMACATAAIAAPASDPASAVADPGRPAEDRAMDAARHPAAILALLKVKPGDTIADIWPGDY